MTDEQKKKIKLMRFWLFGTFIIVWTAVTAYAGVYTGLAIFREPNYWIIIIVAAIACIGGDFGYEAWLRRAKTEPLAQPGPTVPKTG